MGFHGMGLTMAMVKWIASYIFGSRSFVRSLIPSK
jgi:hypothetical protein